MLLATQPLSKLVSPLLKGQDVSQVSYFKIKSDKTASCSSSLYLTLKQNTGHLSTHRLSLVFSQLRTFDLMGHRTSFSPAPATALPRHDDNLGLLLWHLGHLLEEHAGP